MFTVLLAGRFSSSCGTSMAMLLEKRQSNVLLFAADQKDPFFFSTSSMHFAGYHWFRSKKSSKSSQPQPLLKNHGKVIWFFRIRCFFFFRNFTSHFVVFSTYQLLPRVSTLMDSPTSNPPIRSWNHWSVRVCSHPGDLPWPFFWRIPGSFLESLGN